MSARKKSSPKNTKKPALLRYFFDTEFLDDPYNFSCELVSIGILNEKGQEYYGISKEFNLQAAKKEPWIKEHVIDKLDPQNTWDSVEDIRQGVLDLFEPAEKVELWARNGSYDNVLICQLFGGMGEFFKTLKEEKGIDRVEFRDINELKREAGKQKLRLPRLPDAEAHISINDARHELTCFRFMKKNLDGQGSNAKAKAKHKGKKTMRRPKRNHNHFRR